MQYARVAETYARIEATTKRLKMTDSLVELLRATPQHVVDKVVYLTQGKLYPDFVGIEIGIAEKLALRAVARATGYSENSIKDDLEKTGDLGQTTQKFLEKKTQASFFPQPLTVSRVYETLDKIARSTGPGSVGHKMSFLAGLLSDASPVEAKYIVRTITGRLRLGIADMTVLDALAIAYGGGKETREHLERAYNISSDLGRVAKTVVENGIEGVKGFEVSFGKPIRPMLAERLSTSAAILDKLGGRCVAEYKYDGERIQAHKREDTILLFSRRLENITDQYPDGRDFIKAQISAQEAIVEAECVAVDTQTGELKPFQELMHRRRKHGIRQAMKEYPISLFLFDALYINGSDLTLKPYPLRRLNLEQIVEPSDHVKVVESITTHDPAELERFFEEAVESGCEGIICKSLGDDSIYQAGARGWLWIKYKRDYRSELTDTVDLVVVGAFHGRGKRAGTYGALLLAAYDRAKDEFGTVTKCGTGFTDEDLKKLPEMLSKHQISHRHPRVTSTVEAEVWFEPALLIEVIGAELTLSPIHTCALDVIKSGSGLAIRFPRFTGRYRLDKAPEDATTVHEFVNIYRSQLKRING